MLTRAVVVVPAHNEELLLPACLQSLHAAAARCPVPVDVVVVLDACTDDTGRVARTAGARTLGVDARNVGVARAAGVEAALSGRHPASTWIACTDADTRVSPHWLARQLVHAARGADVVTGTIRIADWSDWPPGTGETFHAAYRRGVAGHRHTHVHGANLALTGTAYLRTGGFPPLAVGEDQALVHAAVAAGLRVVRATDIPVVTSARPAARAAGGFSDYLHDLTG